MVLRFIVSYFLNERTIDRLANSYPIRRAAQWTVYAFLRGKSAVEGENGQKALKFKDKFVDELKKEWSKSKGGGGGSNSNL